MGNDLEILVSLVLTITVLGLFGCAFLLAFLPKGHRMQALLAPLMRRLALTVGLVLLAAPVQFATGQVKIYGLAAFVLAGFYWWQFISRDLMGEASMFGGLKTPRTEKLAPIASDIEPQY